MQSFVLLCFVFAGGCCQYYSRIPLAAISLPPFTFILSYFLPFYVTLCIHHRSKRRFTFISPELYLHVLECLSLCLLLYDSSFHSAPLALIRIRPAPLHTYCYNIYYYYILYGIPLYLSVLLSDWERIFSMH